MIDVTYIGDSPEVKFRGIVFPKGKAVSCSKEVAEKLKTNRFFKVGGEAAPEVAEAPAAEEAVVEIEPVAEEVIAEAVEAVQAEAVPGIEIPEDWEGMHHSSRIKLANMLGGNVTTADEANEVIKAEMAKRGNGN